MFRVGDSVRCPRCSVRASKRHCKSPSCGWFRCFCVSNPLIKSIVFDRKLRNFVENK